MTASVRIPTILRSYTGGAKEVDADGSTLAELLEALDTAHPGLKGRVLDENGALRRFVNIYVGDEDVRFVGGLEAPVADGAKVSIIPAVAGGASIIPAVAGGASIIPAVAGGASIMPAVAGGH